MPTLIRPAPERSADTLDLQALRQQLWLCALRARVRRERAALLVARSLREAARSRWLVRKSRRRASTLAGKHRPGTVVHLSAKRRTR
jgi:hypothetical protein